MAKKYVPQEAVEEAVEAAEAMAQTLSCPYLIKSVVPSQMSGGFWLVCLILLACFPNTCIDM